MTVAYYHYFNKFISHFQLESSNTSPAGIKYIPTRDSWLSTDAADIAIYNHITEGKGTHHTTKPHLAATSRTRQTTDIQPETTTVKLKATKLTDGAKAMAKSNIPGILSPDRSEVKTTLTDKTTPMSGRPVVTTASITTSNPDEKKSRSSPQPSETFSEARFSHDFRQVGYVYKIAIYQHPHAMH